MTCLHDATYAWGMTQTRILTDAVVLRCDAGHEMTVPRCAATTLRGSRCAHLARPGKRTCRAHWRVRTPS